MAEDQVELEAPGLEDGVLLLHAGEPVLDHGPVRRVRPVDAGPVLLAAVRPLAVEFGRVVGHREVDLQQAAVADLRRIEGDLH